MTAMEMIGGTTNSVLRRNHGFGLSLVCPAAFACYLCTNDTYMLISLTEDERIHYLEGYRAPSVPRTVYR